MKSFQSSGDGEDKGEVSGDTGFLRKSGRCSQKDRSTGKTRKVDPTRRVTVKKGKGKVSEVSKLDRRSLVILRTIRYSVPYKLK